MPELPEVETIVQQLRRKVVGKTIVKLEVVDTLVDKKIKEILPIKVIDIYRRAKAIIFQLEKHHFLLAHLRMTGHFHYLPHLQDLKQLQECEKFLTAKFYLHDGSLLTHNDIRRFGYIKLLNAEQLQKELAKLGPEPLAPEFTSEKLAQMLVKKKKSTIKSLLMDQHFLAGLGNIYAQEVLYLAGIDPRRKAGELSIAEIKKLWEKIRSVLELAVKHHGTTVENYVHIEGSGGFQRYLTVYQQEKCPKGHLLKKLDLGGRGTSYCSVCQK